MPHMVLALLGPFQVTLDGKPVEGLNSDYLRALLAYLAVESKDDHILCHLNKRKSYWA